MVARCDRDAVESGRSTIDRPPGFIGRSLLIVVRWNKTVNSSVMQHGGKVQRMGNLRPHLKDVLPSLRRFARALARNTHDVDDLVQMTCERALDRSDQWQEDTRLESWLFRVMHTVWLNEIRSRKVRDRYRGQEQDRLSDRVQLAADGAAESKVLLDRVESEIFQLPESERILLLLCCVEGYSYKEAADVARVPIGTVMSRLARARLNLMSRLETSDRTSTDNVRMMSQWRN
jgi:RNA polymerase sigma-70 factor (ECF subfamily)